MDNSLNAQEVLTYAFAREKASEKFYKKLTDTFSDPVMKDIFQSFANDETQHQQNIKFEMIKLGSVVTDSTLKTELDVDFPMPELKNEEEISYADAVLLAIDKESADFKLYCTLAGKVDNDEAMTAFLALAEEEIKHKLRLQRQYDLITERKTD